MDVSTITMDPAAAREKLREYRGRKHKRVDAEYQRAEIAYAELAKGTPLLILSDVMRAAPRDAKGRPRLAIARADRHQVYYQRYADWGGQPRRHSFDAATGGGPPSDTLTIVVPIGADETWGGGGQGGYSLIPMVPPGVLGNRSLKTHFILWEVEAWADSRIGAQPDRDPYLLRQVGEDLYAVVGEWDLTDVERAVMRGRAGR